MVHSMQRPWIGGERSSAVPTAFREKSSKPPHLCSLGWPSLKGCNLSCRVLCNLNWVSGILKRAGSAFQRVQSHDIKTDIDSYLAPPWPTSHPLKSETISHRNVLVPDLWNQYALKTSNALLVVNSTASPTVPFHALRPRRRRHLDPVTLANKTSGIHIHLSLARVPQVLSTAWSLP